MLLFFPMHIVQFLVNNQQRRLRLIAFYMQHCIKLFHIFDKGEQMLVHLLFLLSELIFLLKFYP